MRRRERETRKLQRAMVAPAWKKSESVSTRRVERRKLKTHRERVAVMNFLVVNDREGLTSDGERNREEGANEDDQRDPEREEEDKNLKRRMKIGQQRALGHNFR